VLLGMLLAAGAVDAGGVLLESAGVGVGADDSAEAGADAEAAGVTELLGSALVGGAVLAGSLFATGGLELGAEGWFDAGLPPLGALVPGA